MPAPKNHRSNDLDSFTWKLLRILVRARGRSVTGKELRHTPTRLSKSGEFLDELVRVKLIAIVKEGKKSGTAPAWHSAEYVLTGTGAGAAEYGEYLSTPDGVAVDPVTGQ